LPRGTPGKAFQNKNGQFHFKLLSRQFSSLAIFELNRYSKSIIAQTCRAIFMLNRCEAIFIIGHFYVNSQQPFYHSPKMLGQFHFKLL
jgi:hypothetical protein